MLVPSDVNQCGQDADQDRQAKHCRSETGSELSACAERSLRPWHRDVEIRRRLRRQILTRHRLVAWPWFALGGGYIGGEFRPLDFFGLVPNGLCQWLARILRRYRRNAANRAGGFVRPGLGPRLKPVQLAAQGFDFLGFVFRRGVQDMRRSELAILPGAGSDLAQRVR